MPAKYRSIQTSFWNDSWVIQLTPEQKYFYLFLITNPNVSQCGIYEISLRQMEYHTGYNKDTIEKLLQFFEKKGKIQFSILTSEICITNFSKYNYNSSPKVKIHIVNELNHVKDRSLIQYLYGINTIYKDYAYPIVASSQEKEKEKEKIKEPYFLLENEKITEVFLIEKNYPLDELEKFLNHYSKTGWVDKNGNKITDPLAAARNWNQISAPVKYQIAPEYHEQWKKVWQMYKEKLGFEKAKHLLSVKPQISSNTLAFKCSETIKDACEENIDILKHALRSNFGQTIQLHYKIHINKQLKGVH